MSKICFFWVCNALVFCSFHPPDYTIIENQVSYPLLTPALQDRKTAKIQLNNGVQAYLLSDPNIDQSAAAVCMEAGSWQDPLSYPGMAHFLEHMLFMGSAPYPKEAEYTQYVQDNGGMVNAFTTSDRTVYMFSVNNEAYEGAVDRFSHFFIDPLFNPSCIDRELHNVDQEHAKNIENDFWREHMVLKETSSEGHPMTQFSTGNADTLSGIPQKSLKDWYSTHYGSEKLHLVMLSSLPLETMIDLAKSRFSLVSQTQQGTSPSYGPMLSSKQKGHMIYIQPVKDLKILSIVWELPKEASSITEKGTIELLSYVLSQASESSLIQQLKQEKLAQDLSAQTERFGKDHLLFRIDIELTEKGLSQVDTVLLRSFQTLARVRQRGLPIELFEEMKTLAAIDYQYQSRQEPFSWITEVAYDMADENLSTFPEQTKIPLEFHPDLLTQLVASLTPESATYFLLADGEKLGVTPQCQEKWMNVPYAMKAIPPAKLSLWRQATPHPQIALPCLNPFVPTSLEVLPQQSVSPTLLHKSEKGSWYFAHDEKYKTPEVSLSFSIKTPYLNGSAKSTVLLDLFTKALGEQMHSTLFFAKAAGLSPSFSCKEFEFSFTLSGYSEKASDLALVLFSELKNVSCSEEQFVIYKDALLSSYVNASLELPFKQAMSTLSNVLLKANSTPTEKIDTLKALSFEDFTLFCQRWTDSLYVEGFIFGNIQQEQAAALQEKAENLYESSQGYPSFQKQQMIALPETRGPFKIDKKTDRQGHSTVLAIQEGPFSFSRQASQEILGVALQEAFFDTLRTKQQTGYIARTFASEVDKQLLQTFVVQSSSHVPEDLLHRFELFIEDFQAHLTEILPKERFEHLKKVQITSLEMPPENIYGMASLLKEQAFTYEGDFDRIQKQIAALQALTYEELLKDAHSYFGKANTRRLAILIEGQQPKQKPFFYESVEKKEILEVSSFHSTEAPAMGMTAHVD